jgi:hypothetical protein
MYHRKIHVEFNDTLRSKNVKEEKHLENLSIDVGIYKQNTRISTD